MTETPPDPAAPPATPTSGAPPNDVSDSTNWRQVAMLAWAAIGGVALIGVVLMVFGARDADLRMPDAPTFTMPEFSMPNLSLPEIDTPDLGPPPPIDPSLKPDRGPTPDGMVVASSLSNAERVGRTRKPGGDEVVASAPEAAPAG